MKRAWQKKQQLNPTTEDVFRIERHGTTIQYQRNGEVFYTSEVPSETKLHMDCSFFDQGAALNNLVFSHPEPFTPTPWEFYTYDQNDNAADTHGTGDPTHWNTPSSSVFDALGRALETVERNGPNPTTDWYVTRSTYDIRGNQLTVTDALGRVAFRAIYDLVNHPLRSEGIDAGTERTIFNAIGEAVELRDGKDALILRGYDELNRPHRLWARDEANQALTLREHMIYGDHTESGLSPDQAKAANLLGVLYQHYDEAGRLIFESYDFKGNLLEKVRHVISDSAILTTFESPPADWQLSAFRINWQPPDETTLEEYANGSLQAIPYRTSVTYDALARATAIHYPQDVDGERKVLRPQYNRAGALEQVELDGTSYIAHIAYNAKGQRTLMAYGNGVMTRYAYDPQTFRLTRIRTEPYETPVDAPSTYHPSTPHQPLQDDAYTYDLKGNILSITDRIPESGILNNPDAALNPDPVL